MRPLAARLAALTVASAGLVAVAAGGASAATHGGPDGRSAAGLGGTLDGTLAGVNALPVSTDPVRSLTGGAIDPATDNVDTVGNLPLGTTPVNDMLAHDGDLSSLDPIPVVGTLSGQLARK